MPTLNAIAVATNGSSEIKARQLARELDLAFTTIENNTYPLLLVLTESRLELWDKTQPRLKPLSVDFASGKLVHRQRFGGGRRQLLARAIGIKPKINLTVLDVTAGLGEDAFVLATLGCQVTMLERHPVIAALLRDGLARLSLPVSLSLVQAEACNYLKNLARIEYPDVIYLDPMFPTLQKSALVKKEMRILRTVVGDDLDAASILEAALLCAKKRVVVKRARLAPLLNARQPDVVFTGKSSRFDVYTQPGMKLGVVRHIFAPFNKGGRRL